MGGAHENRLQTRLGAHLRLHRRRCGCRLCAPKSIAISKPAKSARRCSIPRAMWSFWWRTSRVFELPAGFSERLHERIDRELEASERLSRICRFRTAIAGVILARRQAAVPCGEPSDASRSPAQPESASRSPAPPGAALSAFLSRSVRVSAIAPMADRAGAGSTPARPDSPPRPTVATISMGMRMAS